MFINRFTVLSRIAKNKDGTKKISKQQLELDALKVCDHKAIEDKDIWENNEAKLRFRKFPWGHWFMGGMWILGTFWMIYEMYHHLFTNAHFNNVKQYGALSFTFILGVLFVSKGKIKTTVFDKRCGTLTIKKKNICCFKRQLTTYRLKEIMDVKAVYRGYKSGGVDTQEYSIIIMFEKPPGYDSDTDDSYYSSSDDEFESDKAKMRAREDRDYLINKTFGTEETEMTAKGPVRRKNATVDCSDSSDHELE